MVQYHILFLSLFEPKYKILSDFHTVDNERLTSMSLFEKYCSQDIIVCGTTQRWLTFSVPWLIQKISLSIKFGHFSIVGIVRYKVNIVVKYII